jgi:hypothetical protein
MFSSLTSYLSDKIETLWTKENKQMKLDPPPCQLLLKKCNALLSYYCNDMETVWKQFSSEAFALSINPELQKIFTWYEKLLTLTFFVKEDILNQLQTITTVPTDGSHFNDIEQDKCESLCLTNIDYLQCILHMPELQGYTCFTCLSEPIFIDIPEFCQLILTSPLTPAFLETISCVYSLLSVSQLANAT